MISSKQDVRLKCFIHRKILSRAVLPHTREGTFCFQLDVKSRFAFVQNNQVKMLHHVFVKLFFEKEGKKNITVVCLYLQSI